MVTKLPGMLFSKNSSRYGSIFTLPDNILWMYSKYVFYCFSEFQFQKKRHTYLANILEIVVLSERHYEFFSQFEKQHTYETRHRSLFNASLTKLTVV